MDVTTSHENSNEESYMMPSPSGELYKQSIQIAPSGTDQCQLANILAELLRKGCAEFSAPIFSTSGVIFTSVLEKQRKMTFKLL